MKEKMIVEIEIKIIQIFSRRIVVNKVLFIYDLTPSAALHTLAHPTHLTSYHEMKRRSVRMLATK